MTSSANPIEDSDFRAAVIADAATRLAMLRRLGDLGMRLAEDVIERAISSPYHPETKHEPARAFATVSRCVRLTLVLQVKMEARLIALRNGATLSVDDAAGTRATRGNGAAVTRTASDDSLDDTANGSDRSTETLRERESERFDELASGSFDDGVAVVRAGLGLKPGDDIPCEDAGVEIALGAVLEAASAIPALPAPRAYAIAGAAKVLEAVDSG
jgi:hypothetical protein